MQKHREAKKEEEHEEEEEEEEEEEQEKEPSRPRWFFHWMCLMFKEEREKIRRKFEESIMNSLHSKSRLD